MAKKRKRQFAASSLSPAEHDSINRQVTFELNETQLKMIKVGGMANILSGIFVIWILHHQIPFPVLYKWYFALVLINIINIGFSIYYKASRVTPEKMKPWLHAYHFILSIICIVWGCSGVLFASTDLSYQLYTITFLQVVLFGFSIGTITDYVANVISIFFLSAPYLIFQTHSILYGIHPQGYNATLSLGFTVSIFILALFLLVTCYIGYNVVKRSFTLNFENIALNKKVEDMNQFLERRVEERTKELENSLKLVEYQSTHDLLTHLPNDRLLLKKIEQCINAAFNNNHHFAVIFFSLNEIEKISDGLGYQLAENVIRAIGQRFRDKFSMDETDSDYTVTLNRKDIFVIVLDSLKNEDDIEQKCAPLFALIDDPVRVRKHALKLTASAGVAIYPQHGNDTNSLLMNADAAMLSAKQQGGNQLKVYQTKINAHLKKQLEVERLLHTALEKNEFVLHYQPLVDVKTLQICGAEALIRWNSPTLGFIPPDSFIPLSESNGFIVPLGEWIFRTAAKQIKEWHNMGFDRLIIAINMSARQLQPKQFVNLAESILQDVQLRPEFIELELTETVAFRHEVIPILNKLKSMGFLLSIDDFGTGYSGLSNLKLFKIDTLKIDKSFTSDIEANSDSRAIISNTINLAKKMNIAVIAEGVETKTQLDFLTHNHCDIIQGYYFSRPLIVDDFTKLLQTKDPFASRAEPQPS